VYQHKRRVLFLFRDFFKPENHHSVPDTNPESELEQLAFPERRSKRVNVEIVNTEGTAYDPLVEIKL